MNYREIFIVLKRPSWGHMMKTPQTPQEWKRFFSMMDTLERAEIAEFKNGRYVLHPSRKADVLAKAEAVLAEISKPLTLLEKLVAPIAPDDLGGENDWGRWEQLESLDAPEVKAEPVIAPAPVMPEFNVCPTCKGKGRVNIADALGYFGNFLCLTCRGEKQIPVPSRSTFPPVALDAKRVTPNALLFSETPKAAPIPQALEVGKVHVIVESPAPVLSMVAESVASETLVAGDDVTEPFTDAELMIREMFVKSALTQAEDDLQLATLVPADSPTCTGSGMAFDTLSEAPYIRVKSCPDCGGSGEEDTSLKYPDGWELATEAKIAASVLDDDTQPLPVLDSPEDEKPAPELIFEDISELLGVEDLAPNLDNSQRCPECLGHGFINCPGCNGSGYVDTSGNPCSCKPEDYVCFKCKGTGEIIVCSQCGSSEMCRYENEGVEDYEDCGLCVDCCWAKNNKCPECNKTMHSDDGVAWCETCNPEDNPEFVEAEPETSALAIPGLTVVEPSEAIQSLVAPKQYVRINTTGRGLSSGKYEVVRQEEKYGRKWVVVKFTTDKDLPHWFPAEVCELVVEPQSAPKAIEPVVVSRPGLLDGQPIFQVIAQHGLEATKDALNAVATVAIAESLNGNKPFLAEGQGVS